MKISHTIILLLLLLLLVAGSCTSYQSFINFNESPEALYGSQKITNYEPLIIRSSDILGIRISSPNPEALQPFMMSGGIAEGTTGSAYDEYLVDSAGEIELPTIGTISVKGLRVEEVKTKVLGELKPYFKKSPIVQVRLTNFKVNVNGEVRNPGSFGVTNDRLTIIEALTLAGDFTKYSRRDSILIIREEDGIREFAYVNFNSAEVFSSPYYYLQQNDIVYVRPDKRVINSVKDPAGKALPWVSAGISFLAFLFTILRR